MRLMPHRLRTITVLLVFANLSLCASDSTSALLVCDPIHSHRIEKRGGWQSFPHPFFDDSGVGCDIKGPCGKMIADMTPERNATLCGYTLRASRAEPHAYGYRFTIRIYPPKKRSDDTPSHK